jgi:hypothetical protein
MTDTGPAAADFADKSEELITTFMGHFGAFEKMEILHACLAVLEAAYGGTLDRQKLCEEIKTGFSVHAGLVPIVTMSVNAETPIGWQNKVRFKNLGVIADNLRLMVKFYMDDLGILIGHYEIDVNDGNGLHFLWDFDA